MKKIILIMLSQLSIFCSSYSQSFVIYGDKCFGGNSVEIGNDMIKSNDGNLIIIGTSLSDISGNKLVGNCNPTSSPTSDIWILKIDTLFNIIWQKDIGGNMGEVNPYIQLSNSSNDLYFSCDSYSDSSCEKSEMNRGIFTDYWIGLLDGNGNKIWDKTYGGTKGELKPLIQQLTTNELIVCGTSRSDLIGGDKTIANYGGDDYWLVKMDSLGNKIWDRVYGGTGNEGSLKHNLLLSCTNGEFILGGTTGSNLSGTISVASKGITDFWIVKLDNSGFKIWDQRLGGSNYEECNSILQTNDNGFLLGGETISPVSGDVSEPSRGNGDAWVVKIDSLGNKQWDKRFGGNGTDIIYSMTNSIDGGYFLVCSSSSNMGFDVSEPKIGGSDYWIVKIDSLGNKLWDKRFGGAAASNTPASLVELADSSIVVFGASDSGASAIKTDPGYGSVDYWIVRFKYFPSNVGIEEMNLFNQSVAIFPNPAKDFITINSQNVPIKKIELVNLLGETLYSQTIENAQTTQLNLQPYPPGFYFVKVSSEKYTVTKRLVKE